MPVNATSDNVSPGETPEESEEKKRESAEDLECRRERDEYLNGWKRAQADLVNYKRDEEERFREFACFHHESFVRELLQVMESFDQGLGTLEEGSEVRAGMERIQSQLLGVLEGQGVQVIHAPPGSPFDPSREEALGEVVTAEYPPGSVAEEVRVGYLLFDKVIAPARVRLAKGQGESQGNNKL